MQPSLVQTLYTVWTKEGCIVVTKNIYLKNEEESFAKTPNQEESFAKTQNQEESFAFAKTQKSRGVFS